MSDTNKPKLLNDAELAAALEATIAPRVTKESIEANIVKSEFTKIGDTITHCRIILNNGFSVTGESACVNVENHKQDIGERIAYDTAFQKLWGYYGFLLAQKQYLTQG